MKSKHVKLYEDYQLEIDCVKIYESIAKRFNNMLNEQKDWDDDEDDEMTPGERRAFERGLQVMTKPQMAALYLLAKGRSKGVGADYMKLIDGIEEFGYTDETDGSFNITVPAMADAIGMMSDRTLNYTQRKFQNMIGGLGETASQSLSPKLKEAYAALSQKNDTTVAAFAASCIQDTSNTINRDSADSRREETNTKASERNTRIKKENEEFVQKLDFLVKGFQAENMERRKQGKAQLGIAKYSKIIWSKFKNENPNVKLNNIYDMYEKMLNTQNLSVRLHIKAPIVA